MEDFNFAEAYKKISNIELFDILENAENYQYSAIEAARNELNNRQLSSSEIDEARGPLIAAQIEKNRQAEKNKVLEEKLKAAGKSIHKSIDPFDTDPLDSSKKILVIIIIYGSLFVMRVTRQFDIILSSIKDIINFPVQNSILLLPLIAIPVALLTFWKRKTAGWSLLGLCVTFSGMSALQVLYKNFNFEPSGLFSNFLNQRAIRATDIFYVFVILSILYVMCKKDIRKIYKIDVPKMAGIIFIGALLSLIIISGHIL